MNADYDNLAEKYDSIREQHSYIQNLLKEKISFQPTAHIHTDLGCGTCKDTFILENKVKQFIGIDFSKNMLAIAQKKVITGSFIYSDLQSNIPLPSNTVNSVSIISFYHHILNKEFFFSEVNRIMTENSILIIITNTIEQLEQRGYYHFFKTALSINKNRFLQKDVLESMLRKNKFSILESIQINRPISYWGEEFFQKIKHPAFDSVLTLIDKSEFEEGLKNISFYVRESKQKIICCRDKYLIVCRKETKT